MQLQVGIDEVARGCLAGPVVSCAVILKPDVCQHNKWIEISTDKSRPKITDSKKMKPVDRQIAKDWIIDHGALAWGLGQASVTEIDQLNIREATFLAMNRALDQCLSDLPGEYKTANLEVIIDGNAFKPIPGPNTKAWLGQITYRTQVKGDLLVPSIACASIVAKESRDADLDALVAQNPGELTCYGWDKNRAYGTSDHCRAILMNGITVWHRLSFLDKLLAPGRNT